MGVKRRVLEKNPKTGEVEAIGVTQGAGLGKAQALTEAELENPAFQKGVEVAKSGPARKPVTIEELLQSQDNKDETVLDGPDGDPDPQSDSGQDDVQTEDDQYYADIQFDADADVDLTMSSDAQESPSEDNPEDEPDGE